MGNGWKLTARMWKPYEKDNKRGDEDERYENDDSKRVIFVHRPNFHLDEILRACQSLF